MDRCARCGPVPLEEAPAPPGSVHHARLVCGTCGRFVKWLPKPQAPGGGPVPRRVAALVHPRPRPAPLEGSEAQCRFARSLRASLLHNLAFLGRADLVAVVRCVTDATWFIANKGRRCDDLRWPAPDQMEPPVASGPCINCGDPAYSGQVCSDECADEFSASLVLDRDRDARERAAGWVDL